jgi:hypothetical protein
MYACAMDAETATLVVRWSGRTLTADEFQEAHRDVQAFVAATPSDKPALFIIVVGKECPAPSAAERQRFANAIKGMDTRPAFFAFVTESIIARGVIAAIRWLRPKRPQHQERDFATSEKATAWVQEVLPSHVRAATALLEQVHPTHQFTRSSMQLRGG